MTSDRSDVMFCFPLSGFELDAFVHVVSLIMISSTNGIEANRFKRKWMDVESKSRGDVGSTQLAQVSFELLSYRSFDIIIWWSRKENITVE